MYFCRHIDEQGRLHSVRLLTIRGNLPTLFKPFVPVSSVYMIEDVVVDPKTQTMHVHTVRFPTAQLDITSSSLLLSGFDVMTVFGMCLRRIST